MTTTTLGRVPRTPECGHPDRPHFARGLCKTCYDSERYAGELHKHPRTRPLEGLVQRAEELRAELEAAAEFTGERISWRVVAEKLGVKPATLERARVRARARARRAADEAGAASTGRDLLDEDPYLFLDEGEEVA